jgi:hypothetical protein
MYTFGRKSDRMVYVLAANKCLPTKTVSRESLQKIIAQFERQ